MEAALPWTLRWSMLCREERWSPGDLLSRRFPCSLSSAAVTTRMLSTMRPQKLLRLFWVRIEQDATSYVLLPYSAAAAPVQSVIWWREGGLTDPILSLLELLRENPLVNIWIRPEENFKWAGDMLTFQTPPTNNVKVCWPHPEYTPLQASRHRRALVWTSAAGGLWNWSSLIKHKSLSQTDVRWSGDVAMCWTQVVFFFFVFFLFF